MNKLKTFYGLFHKTYLENKEKAPCFVTETNFKEIRKIQKEEFPEAIVVKITAREISPLKLQTVRSKILY